MTTSNEKNDSSQMRAIVPPTPRLITNKKDNTRPNLFMCILLAMIVIFNFCGMHRFYSGAYIDLRMHEILNIASDNIYAYILLSVLFGHGIYIYLIIMYYRNSTDVYLTTILVLLFEAISMGFMRQSESITIDESQAMTITLLLSIIGIGVTVYGLIVNNLNKRLSEE